jgi:DNA-binding transcriptional ArsR family regulator
MMNKELSKKWPQQLINANRIFSNDKAINVLLFLMEKKDALSFTELSSNLGIKQDSLSYYLSKLVEAGLVENIFERRNDTSDRSFYFVSEFGKLYVDKQLETVENFWNVQYRTVEKIVVTPSKETSAKTGGANETLPGARKDSHRIMRGGIIETVN